ncbi:hypothetical protein EJD97_008447, partial [Solanum chilense]
PLPHVIIFPFPAQGHGDVAQEINLPPSFWSYFCIPHLIQAEELPLKENAKDLTLTKVKGMEDILRGRDVPSFCQGSDLTNSDFRIVMAETPRARGTHLKIWKGPYFLKFKRLWQEDESCMTWLDTQTPKSMIYVSFGSIAGLTKEEPLEFWYGLVNSDQKFLWVMRPDLIIGQERKDEIPVELEQGTKARGYMQVNSKFVGEVWKMGLDIKDTCDRDIIAKLIRENDEFSQTTEHMASLAKKAINEGGSSSINLDRLIQDIRSVIPPHKQT